MNLQLVTLSGIAMDEEVYEVIIPTTSGEIAVFPGHEPLVTIAQTGVLTVRRERSDLDKQLEFFAINGGVVEIEPERVRILVDEANSSEDIIEAEVEKALALAKKQKSEAKSQVEINKAQDLIDRQAVKLKVAGLRRHHRR